MSSSWLVNYGIRRRVTKDTKTLVADHYPQIAQDLLKPLLRLFSHCIDVCNSDMTKFMIMLVVGLRTTMHRDFASRTQAELLSGEIPVFPSLPISVRSIAEILGLPKETIRRKVKELADAGWLAREHGRLYFTAAAYRQLAPIREQIEDLAARYYEVVAALKAGKIELFGSLMNSSHDSLRYDYEVSCPELDSLVEFARTVPGVYGSRMTGAGFGGCTVSLTTDEAVEEFKATVGEQYKKKTGIDASFYVCKAADGASRIR